MSITNYSDLVAALDGMSGYLHRTDLTAKIPDFIKVCESRINRNLQILGQEVEASLTATVGSRTMPLPTLFQTPIALWLTTYDPRWNIVFLDASALPVVATNGPARFYTIDGSNIATDSPADITYTYTLRYVTGVNLASTLTNVVMTQYPDIYIYGTCLASIGYTRDQSQLALWQGLYDQAMKEAMTNLMQTKSKQTLRTEFSRERPRIIRGF